VVRDTVMKFAMIFTDISFVLFNSLIVLFSLY